MSMNNEQTKRNSWGYLLLSAAEKISLTDVQYKMINERYNLLKDILSASDNPLLAEAHILVQGSIALKTTIKPVPGAPAGLDTIDADAIVFLPHARGAGSEEVLRAIEECFQNGSRIRKHDIEQLRRGIRIPYADENPGFHIDVTPARAINGNNLKDGMGNLEVPDRETGWKASSPIPYIEWLQSASEQPICFAEQKFAQEATQEPLPSYHEYLESNPLHATIKLLKRHRDEWAIRSGFEDYRPISAIITTLATHAYLDLVKEPQLGVLRPVDIILRIVSKMKDYIKSTDGKYFVCNPKDEGENFAEKWNRPDEGDKYAQAFMKWYEEASTSMSLGLEEFNSIAEFAEAMHKDFGLESSFITEVNNTIHGDWVLPSRSADVTRNSIISKALFGGLTATENSQEDVKPVGRLG